MKVIDIGGTETTLEMEAEIATEIGSAVTAATTVAGGTVERENVIRTATAMNR